MRLARRFPSLIPAGTRLLQWALLDATARRRPSSFDDLFTVHSTIRTIEASINRMPSLTVAVGIYSHRCSIIGNGDDGDVAFDPRIDQVRQPMLSALSIAPEGPEGDGAFNPRTDQVQRSMLGQ